MSELTLQDLLAMTGKERFELMTTGHPLDLDQLDGTQYLGVDLSLPRFMNAILWKTFRKTFVRDPGSGTVRGWNVRLEQHGVDADPVPMTDKAGQQLTFGHYHVRSAEGLRFPRGWSGGHYLDYGVAGNTFLDPGRVGYTPLVAVNAGSMDLLLGWEVVRIGPVLVPIPDYWALCRPEPLQEIVAPPRA